MMKRQSSSFLICRIMTCTLCTLVAQLQEAKNKVEEEKTAVEEDRQVKLLLNKAVVSFLLPH